VKDQDIHQGDPKLPFSDTKSFIETQFPVAKISMESYKERKAVAGQTLTGLGKWWGRKPLVLVRAVLLGLLMPTSNNPKKDAEIFLKLMTMDSEGLWLRKRKNIPNKKIIAVLKSMSPSIKEHYLVKNNKGYDALKNVSPKEKLALQRLIFDRLPYDEKLRYCFRPEEIEGPSKDSWIEINSHLGTNSSNLNELIHELGFMKFGYLPTIGDAFCGSGAIPFEAARIGFDAFGSDLNPVASLLSWASMNILGGGDEIHESVLRTLNDIYDSVDQQITDWGIEHNSLGWRANAYLYCLEVVDPESNWRIPLAPSWVIGRRTKTIARLIPDYENRCYDIEILSDVSKKEIDEAHKSGTIINSRLIPPNGKESTPIDVVREGMRIWDKKDFVPRPGDVFQERLFCIQWIETFTDESGKEKTRRHYRAPTNEDLAREAKVIELLKERFFDWQENGFIPSQAIEPGTKTDEPIRTRGWIYWHHLYSPRQLLVNGLLSQSISLVERKQNKVAALLALGRCADYNSKLCRWDSAAGSEKTVQTFYNQAVNPLYNYASRSFQGLSPTWLSRHSNYTITSEHRIVVQDARMVDQFADIWITDPPYADAINYEEITELFLSWYSKWIPGIFPDWYVDTKRALAVKGNDSDFRKAMIDCYQNLSSHMNQDGYQVVMFTHQDASVWADLALILWAAGLHVTAAWTIATETDSTLRKGNYVQGTVILILKKRSESEPVFLDEINHKIEHEVRQQLNYMVNLEDSSDPNFGDADYQLAAYAAALRILTERPIYEIDPERDILREYSNDEISPVEQIIRNAVRIACDHLVPKGFDGVLWKGLSPMERFYLKGIEVESHGEYRNGVYQELARGFGAVEYTDLLSNTKANETRLKKPSEFGRKNISGEGFSGSLLRTCLFAIYQVDKDDEVNLGLNWFHTELSDYWTVREKIIKILEYLALIGNIKGMEHWKKEAQAASLLAGAVRNDHV
jgi:putative DNA methylase